MWPCIGTVYKCIIPRITVTLIGDQAELLEKKTELVRYGSTEGVYREAGLRIRLR